MADFQPINTQEELNAVIRDRLERQTAKHQAEVDALKEQYADYDALKKFSDEGKSQMASLEEQVEKYKAASASYEQSIKDKDAEIAKYARAAAKTNIAIETGLPIELANRLTGDTEEELKADAKKLLALVGTRTTAPIANPEQPEEDGVMAAFKKLNPNLKF